MKNILFSFILMTLFSCKNDKKLKNPHKLSTPEISEHQMLTYDKESIKDVQIDPSEITVIDFDEFFKLEKLVYLGDTKPIGNILKTFFYKDKIIAIDNKNAKKIICFNKNGKFLWEYSHYGEGPQEYKEITDVTIDHGKEKLIILDEKSFKLIDVSIETGNFLSSQKIDTYSVNLVNYNGDNIIHTYGKSYDELLNYKLLTFNADSKIISRNLPIVSNIDIHKNLVPEQPFSVNHKGDLLYFTEAFNDTVYKIENNKIQALYKVNYKNHSIDYDEVNKLSDVNRIRKSKYYIDIPMSNIIDSKESLIFNYNYPNKGKKYLDIVTTILDKNTLKTKQYNFVKNHPLSDKVISQQLFDTTDGEYLVQIIYPSIHDRYRRIIKNANNEEPHEKVDTFVKILKEKRSDLFSLIMQTNEYSNPVLAFYKIKKTDENEN